jgi:predicted ATPase/transcriptional regulator with XRE-family HTH domain
MVNQRRPFGDLLKHYRLAARLTHERLAERSGLSARTISDVERGVSRRPRRETVDLLSEALRLSPADRTAFQAAARDDPHAVSDSVTTGRRTGSIPVHLTSFIGRSHELRVTRDLLCSQRVRLVTLTGPGGAGKSRLAAHIATDLAGEIDGGVHFVELAPVAATDDFVPAIARALDIARPNGAATLADIVAAMGDGALLLVLDNFEHLLDAAPLLSELLRACPRLSVLATSRASLRLSGEHEVAVPPLSVPHLDGMPSFDALASYPSVRLFVDRARQVNPAFALTPENGRTVAAICARLDGLPLALELAAARTKLLTADALLRRLDAAAGGSALRLLTRGTRDVPPHQRTLRDTILWSYNLLTPAEQRLLRRLAIFAGGCTLEAVEALFDALAQAGDGPDEPPDVVEGLGSLLDKSLVYLDEGAEWERRFVLLETVRELALEELRASGEFDALARAHASYYLEQVKAFGALLFASSADQRRSATEYHNLQDALRWLLHHG